MTVGSPSTDYVQTGPYNKEYTESQLQAGGGFILPDFNEEQVGKTSVHFLPAAGLARGSSNTFQLLLGNPEALHGLYRPSSELFSSQLDLSGTPPKEGPGRHAEPPHPVSKAEPGHPEERKLISAACIRDLVHSVTTQSSRPSVKVGTQIDESFVF